MEQTLIFVLGIVAGLVLMGLVYAFTTVFKMKKKSKEYATEKYTEIMIDHAKSDLLAEFNIFEEKEYRVTIDEIHRRIDELYKDLTDVLGDAHKYVDSRFDKSENKLDGEAKKRDESVARTFNNIQEEVDHLKITIGWIEKQIKNS